MTEASSACDCLAERSRTETVTYSLAPRAGGGWAAWGAALTALIVRLTAAPTHCAIIDQRPNERYLQLMLGHGHARLEASGNGYLTGDFRLGESEERVLAGLGFRRPSTADSEDDLPENWSIDQPAADPAQLAQLVTATASSVMAFDNRWPITIDVFGADAPCEACCWAGV